MQIAILHQHRYKLPCQNMKIIEAMKSIKMKIYIIIVKNINSKKSILLFSIMPNGIKMKAQTLIQFNIVHMKQRYHLVNKMMENHHQIS